MAAEVVRLETRRRGAWRAAVGGVLRGWRTDQGLRLADVAQRAGVSVQYLSEVERGRKEPSSEVLGAVTEALGSSLADLALGVAEGLGRDERRRERPGRPVLVLRGVPATGSGSSGAPARSSGTPGRSSGPRPAARRLTSGPRPAARRLTSGPRPAARRLTPGPRAATRATPPDLRPRRGR